MENACCLGWTTGAMMHLVKVRRPGGLANLLAFGFGETDNAVSQHTGLFTDIRTLRSISGGLTVLRWLWAQSAQQINPCHEVNETVYRWSANGFNVILNYRSYAEAAAQTRIS